VGRISDNYPGISLLGGWVVGLTVDNGSHPIIFNESLVRIQFQNQLYQVGNLDQPCRVTYTVKHVPSIKGLFSKQIEANVILSFIYILSRTHWSGTVMASTEVKKSQPHRVEGCSHVLVNDCGLFLGIMLQLSSRVSSMGLLG
jgi:hypothetical protein